MNVKKLSAVLQSLAFFSLLVASWGFFPTTAEAACTYSGTLSWGGNCGATVNETVAEGASKNVINTNPGYEGIVTYTCQSGAFVKGNDWCQVAPVGACAVGSGGGFGGGQWTTLDGSTCSDYSYAQAPRSWVSNGGTLTLTNTLPGVTGSATYTCNNGSLSPSGNMTCTPGSSSGGGTTPPPGGGTTPPPGGGTTPPPGPSCTSITSGPCSQYAGQFGIPGDYKSGTALILNNSCTYTQTYLSGCSLGGAENCVPNTSCAANFCTYEVCYDGCGGVIGGTKQCNQGLCTPDNSCTLTTPVGSTCVNNCGQTVPGVKSTAGPVSNPGPGQSPGPGTTNPGPTGPILGSAVLFQNPLKFNNVNDLVTSLLSFLQGFIVVIALIFIIVGAFLYITSAGNDGRMETGKKAILAAIIGLALGIAAPAFLREIGSILGWTTPNVPSGVGTSLSLLEIMTNVLSFLLTIIGIIAIIMLVLGGFLYLTAAGNEDQIDRGKKIVKYSVMGILIALAALVLVKQVAGFFV